MTVKLPPLPHDRHREIRQIAAEELKFDRMPEMAISEAIVDPDHKGDPPALGLLTFMRVYTLTLEDVGDADNFPRVVEKLSQGQTVSRESDMRAVEALLRLLKSLYAAYPTSHEVCAFPSLSTTTPRR